MSSEEGGRFGRRERERLRKSWVVEAPRTICEELISGLTGHVKDLSKATDVPISSGEALMYSDAALIPASNFWVDCLPIL